MHQQEEPLSLEERSDMMMEVTAGLEVVHLASETMNDTDTQNMPPAMPPPASLDRRPYDDIVEAGPAAPPIEFQRPLFERGRRAEVLCYHPDTQRHEQLENVLLRDYSREFPDGDMRVTRAYWPHPFKAPINTIMGHLEICVVLERSSDGSSSDGSSSSDEEDDEEAEEDVVFQTTETFVAVKVNYSSRMESLKGRHAEDPLKEIAAMQLIGNGHPNVLGCNEVLFDGENLNVVLPFCGGGDLFELLQDSERAPDSNLPGMSEEAARYWFRQIIAGIRHLHSVGVCHRDISPENIMIDNNLSLIIDMGMCLRVPYTNPNGPSPDAVTDITHGTRRRLIISQGACGKLPYMSPEIYRSPLTNEPFDGCAADIWTAGTIFFCMVTGNRSYQRPHESDHQFYWMTQGLQQLLADWQVQLSDEGYHLLHNMLQVDPRMRLSLEEIENHPWFQHPDAAL